jgi:MFS family permease
MTGAQGVGNASAIFLGAFILQALGPYGGVRLPVFGYLAAWRLVFFIVGAPGFIVILLLLAVREPARRERAKREESKAFLPFLRRHSAAFTLTIASLTSTVLVNTGFATWIAAILMRIHHMPPAKIGVTLGPILLCVVPVCVMLGGAASDWLSRRVPSIGRLGVPLFAYPVLTLVHLIWWRVDSAAASLLGFTLSACVIHALISGTLYPALNQMVPNEMRGQTTTLMLVLLSILGYSISPTLVALLNDDFFKDPMMLRQSVALVGVPTGVLGFLFTLFALKPYRRACAETAALTAGS